MSDETNTEQCSRCGHANPPWAAASPLWNEVMRGGSINGDEEGGIICAACFMELAESRGIASRFRVTAEVVNVELETTTPSGRVWDEEQFLWTASPPPDPLREALKRIAWNGDPWNAKYAAELAREALQASDAEREEQARLEQMMTDKLDAALSEKGNHE